MQRNEILLESLLLSAEIEMQGMIAENKYLEQENKKVKYRKSDFDEIIRKYSILNLAEFSGDKKSKTRQFMNELASSLRIRTCP